MLMPNSFSSVVRTLALFLVPSSIAAFVVLSARPLPFGPSFQAQAVSVSTPVQQTAADPQTDKEQGFQARCKAEGVLKCVGWDNPSDFSPAGDGYADGLYPAGDGTFQGQMDTSVKTSGAGSLRFTIRPKVVPNATGYW